MIPLFITTKERLMNNFSMYWYEKTTHGVPGGGGFSIICFTLQALYQLFTKCQAYWTRSNNNFPLVRFTGATIKLYRAEKADYICTYHSCYPLKPNLDTYNSTQPSILQLNKRHKIVTCKQNNRNKKPYTKFKIKPPAPMQSKWFFQKDLADKPLCMLMTSAASFDRYYLSANAESTTIGFKCLDTSTFQYHNWEAIPTTGYKPNDKKYLWALTNGNPNFQKEKLNKLIYLGDSKNMKPGDTIASQAASSNCKQAWQRYMQSQTNWGNPFWPEYLNQEKRVLYSTKSPHEIEQTLPDSNTNWPELGADFQIPTHALIQECRYNPYQDSGNNHIFLAKITDIQQTPWQQPTDPKLEGRSYPIWLSLWGFVDYMKNTVGYKVDTDYVVVIVSDCIEPKLGYFIPIDEDFLQGRSKYQPDNSQPFTNDKLHWHPKTTFQLSSLNTICSCGPGTIKLPDRISAEAHCRFTFYFKLGGCGPEPNEIENPELQPTFPTPNNFLQTTSLQSPRYPLEHFIYGFDQRRGYLTEKACQRIAQIITTKDPITSITDCNYLQGKTTPPETSEESSEEEETQKQALLLQLQQQRLKQLKFRQRILQLIQQLHLE